jgi:hypothetical protein
MDSFADRSAFRRAGLALALPLLLAACGGSQATPTAPANSASPNFTTSAAATESALPGVSGSALPSAAPSAPGVGNLYLRRWSVNGSIGPNGFFASSTVVYNGSLYYEPDPSGDTPALLYMRPMTAAITAQGLATIAAEARRDGLLGTKTTFDCPHAADGGMIAGAGILHVTIVVDGVTHELSGSCFYEESPTPAPGSPAPGSYEAFLDFVAHVDNMIGWLGDNLATPTAWVPTQLAVIAALPDQAFWSPEVDPADTAQWHLGAFTAWGALLDAAGDPAGAERCGILSGAGLATEMSALTAAHDGTLFIDTAGQKRVLGIHVLMPNEPPTACGG